MLRGETCSCFDGVLMYVAVEQEFVDVFHVNTLLARVSYDLISVITGSFF